MRKLKIAVYYPWIYLKGGVERSMAALITRSRHDWTIFTSRFEPENTFPEFAQFKVVTLHTVSVKRTMLEVFKSALRILTTRLPLEDFDAYVVWCDGLGPLTLFRNHTKPSFCICSTPLRAAYDPVYVREALHSRGFFARIVYRLLMHSFVQVDRLAWRSFAGVVSTSIEVEDRIVNNRLHPRDERMILRHPGIAVADAPASVAYEPFFLVPGRIAWTKNVQLAVEAFITADLPAPWRLVIAGFVDRKSQTYFANLQKRAAAHRGIEFIVNPSDAALNELYRTAYAVLFTPLNEDWGMAPLEGMLRSKAIVANASGGPLESVQDGVTGWLLQPEIPAWSAVLRTMYEQPTTVRERGRRARAAVVKFDWGNFVSGVDDLIEAVLHRTPYPTTKL